MIKLIKGFLNFRNACFFIFRAEVVNRATNKRRHEFISFSSSSKKCSNASGHTDSINSLFLSMR